MNKKGVPKDGCYTAANHNYDLVVSTTLVIVMIFTLVFGTFMKPVQRCLVPPSQASANEYANTTEELEKAEILRLRRMESSGLDTKETSSN